MKGISHVKGGWDKNLNRPRFGHIEAHTCPSSGEFLSLFRLTRPEGL
jgi:hypothetical protein